MVNTKGLSQSPDRNWYAVTMAICTGFFLLMHLTFVGFTNDDVYFRDLAAMWDSVPALVVDRYLTDSSRVLSETILFILVQCPFIVWQLLDTLICILLCHSACVLLINDKQKKENLLVLALFAIYPYMHVGSAGWICTSLNYMWPMATLTYALSGAMRRIRGEKTAIWQYALYVPALVFTANCEMSATVLVFAGAYLLVRYFAIRKEQGPVIAAAKKDSGKVAESISAGIGFETAILIIGLAGLIFAMTAPGNGERTAMEARNWMPEFPDLNLFQKFRLCAVFVFEHFVMIPDVPFFLFSLLLLFAGWNPGNVAHKNAKRVQKISCIPIAIDVAFTSYYFVRDFLIGHKKNYDYTTPAIYLTEPYDAVVQIAELAAFGIYIAATLYVLWNLTLPLWKRIGMIWALGTGFAVRMALMLSPTMFSSWHRTLIFLYFAFLGDSFMLMKLCNGKKQKYLIRAVLIAGVIVNLILTVGLQIRKAG
ncbi:MAG: hypothetical protein K6B69_12200 [Lachnospiraceae bacterium]|nr:hypothetical protein [Lachnospiraceae bacterium]